MPASVRDTVGEGNPNQGGWGHSCAWVILVVALVAYQCRYKRVPLPRNPTRVLQSAPTLDRLMTRHPNVTSRPPRACGAPCQSAALLVHEAERVLQEATDADGRLDVRTAQREYAHRRQLYKGNTTVRHFYMIERVRVDGQDQFVWRATPEADSVNFTSKEVNATLVSAECPSGICDDHAINVVMFKDTNPTTKRYSYVEYPWFNRKTNAVGYGVDIVCRYNQDVYICAGYNYPDTLPTPPDCGVALTVMGIYSLFFVGMFLLPGVYHQLAPNRKRRRASSVVVSGTPVVRPNGQLKGPDDAAPRFGPSQRFDLELEMGAIVGQPSNGPISVSQAFENIFGYVLLNDWSARDIQAWEYQPLGPFQAKATANTISPWIITKAALEPFRTSTPPREKELLPYLTEPGPMLYDIPLSVSIQPEGAKEAYVLSRTNYKEMYYSAAQQLAHHTTAGSPMNVGDLLGSGTISGPTKPERGSLLELSWGGKEPIELPDGSTRTFIEDGDTLTLSGAAEGNGYRIGFGDCVGKLLPALEDPYARNK